MSQTGRSRIVFKQASDLIDRHVGIQLLDCQPHSLVTVTANMTDQANILWQSHAGFLVGASGALDLNETVPSFGSFTEPGTDGFFWSMAPVTDLDPSAFKESGAPPAERGSKRGHRLGLPDFGRVDAFDVSFSVACGGETIAARRITRSFTPPDVTRSIIRTAGVRGVLFEPSGSAGLPGIILISGSGGGVYEQDAALLASHGFSVLALAYFNYDDLPVHQLGVTLEYFEKAITWFRGHLGHHRIGITGPSKGGEGSLVVASALPDMIKAAAPIVPGDLYLCAVDAHGIPHAAWTHHDVPFPWAGNAEDWERVPEALRVPKTRTLFNARMNLEPFYASPDVYDRAAIPVEQMRCPVLLIWGQDDQAWPSALSVERIMKRLYDKKYAYPVESYGEQGAGHFFTFPGFPTSLSDSIIHPLLPIYMTMGGTAASTARLQRIGWCKLIDFFRLNLAP